MTSILLTLPLPPSVNVLYANVPGRGRIKTAKYRKWLKEAGWELKAQNSARNTPENIISGKYELILRVPEGMRGDIDNRLKAILDLLVAHRITLDDRWAWGIWVRRAPDLKGYVTVEIREVVV